MADYVTVANYSLSLLGENDQIRDPDEDSHAARTIRAAWDVVRQAVLRDALFNFSISRDELAAVAGAVPYPFQSAFALPDGFLRLIEILDPACTRDTYSLEGGRILADTAGPLYIRCVKDVTDVGLWDALFVDAFAKRLAFQVGDRITGDRGRKNDAWAAYRAAIGPAKHADAMENPPIVPDEDPWIMARYC